MTYLPINSDVYALAFQGSQSGLSDFGLGNSSASYNPYSTLSQLWAQAFDTAWNSAVKLNEVQAIGILDGSYKFWLGVNSTVLVGQTALTLAPLTTPIIASIASSVANFAGQSITPPIWGGSQGNYTVTVGVFFQPSVFATVSITVGTTLWMVPGEILFIANGGYYQVSSVTSPSVVILTNIGYPGNVGPGYGINSGSGVTASGIQGAAGSLAGLTPTEILFGSSAGQVQQSTKLTWTDASSTLGFNGAGPGVIQSANGTTGTALNVATGTGTAGHGGSLVVETGPGTTSGGNMFFEAGNATAAAGTGGLIGLIAGAGSTTGAGGEIALVGGNSSTGTGGNITLQPGASTTNGRVILLDGNGAAALTINNGGTFLDAPLLGDPNTNNPLCFGIATVGFPSISNTVTLTNTQYNNYCIRMTGSVNFATSTIVFPDVPGGYTKQLDLTQVSALHLLTSLVIKAGTGSPSTKVVTINATVSAAIYTINYDGTTLTCSPTTQVVVVSPGSQGATVNGSWTTLATGGIQAGSSGVISASFTNYLVNGVTGTYQSLQFRFTINSAVPTYMPLYTNVAPLSSYQTYTATFAFTGLIPGSANVIAAQMLFNNSYPLAATNNCLTLLSP